MKNPYVIDNARPEHIRAGQALENMICKPASELLDGSGSTQSHTDFTLPNDDGALVVIRFAGPKAAEQAKRLRHLIDAWR